MGEEERATGCSCGGTCGPNVADLLRAAPPKKSWLRKATCPMCGQVFWTDRDSDYCFDCVKLADKRS